MQTEHRTDEQPIEGAAPAATGWLRTFTSLRNRDYRWLWIGYLFSFGAISMQMVARGWLVYDVSSSAFFLGLVMSMWGIAVLLLSPIGGVIADRVNKRDLLIVTQGILGVISFGVAVLITMDRIEIWHLIVASFLSGIVFAFNMPARQAFIAELVPERDLMNAIALSSSAMNLMRIAAPAIAGFLVEILGVAGVYWLITAFYFFVVISLLRIGQKGSAFEGMKNSMKDDLVEGLTYVWRDRSLVSLLVLGFLAVLLGWNYQAFMPAIAVDVLKTGAGGFGVLMAFSGIGALIGTLAVATLGDVRWKGALMVGMLLAFAISLIAFSFSSSYIMALILIMIVGLASMSFLTINNTILQLRTAPQMRGRVMSLMMMTWGLQPVGVLPFGILADMTTSVFAVGLGGAMLLVAGIATIAVYPQVRRL